MAGRSLRVRCVYAACLLGATYNHVVIVARHGLAWDYGGVGWVSAAFWTSLTFFDPLAVALLFVRPRTGVVATGIIIVTDVAHNLWIVAHFAPRGRFLASVAADPFMVSQIAFLLFVGATARLAWPPPQEAVAHGQRVGTGSAPE
ncbi:hypothetical protein LQ953_14210 [Sphingomonas sp. IC-56]|uniref:hypothetical protein n=1 Tax=Sphingomonas sp. IC-56 TaxID=2898529 RepID=UPI001E499D44|nr:hypothetical protein [Sphingomonas sp. IC-56]MCD2325172.1 hypothetical protein [Sphingomonas sp. IC-56]